MTQDESRAAKRLKVLKTGKVIFNKNLAVINCTVRDLSETGAKLVFGDASVVVPDEIKLVLQQDNTVREAKVMWRKGEAIGVHFTSEARRAPPRKF